MELQSLSTTCEKGAAKHFKKVIIGHQLMTASPALHGLGSGTRGTTEALEKPTMFSGKPTILQLMLASAI